ncbi:MAG: YceK/YidQ family lipoprotein [Sinimarinibacterium sp.]|jgi:uncharacterized protein YceK
MSKPRLLTALALSIGASALSGCGTYYTKVVRNNPTPYSGTALDARVMAHYYSLGHVWCGLPSCADRWMFLGDLPFSLVADTLVLPLTLVAQLEAADTGAAPPLRDERSGPP